MQFCRIIVHKILIQFVDKLIIINVIRKYMPYDAIEERTTFDKEEFSSYLIVFDN